MSLRASLHAHLTTSGILRFNSDASANLRNVAPPSSHLRVASAFTWNSTICRWTVSHDLSRVHQCIARLGAQSLGDPGSLGILADPVVFFPSHPPLRQFYQLGEAQRGVRGTSLALERFNISDKILHAHAAQVLIRVNLMKDRAPDRHLVRAVRGWSLRTFEYVADPVAGESPPGVLSE
jgi:hypothetical protein